MSQPSNLGPLKVVAAGKAWRISLPASDELMPDLPADLEKRLSSGLADLLRQSESSRIFLDLNNMPAISSHQLGLMLALQKALRDKLGKLPVSGASDTVRKLLEMTNTAQFFEFMNQAC